MNDISLLHARDEDVSVEMRFNSLFCKCSVKKGLHRVTSFPGICKVCAVIFLRISCIGHLSSILPSVISACSETVLFYTCIVNILFSHTYAFCLVCISFQLFVLAYCRVMFFACSKEYSLNFTDSHNTLSMSKVS